MFPLLCAGLENSCSSMSRRDLLTKYFRRLNEVDIEVLNESLLCRPPASSLPLCLYAFPRPWWQESTDQCLITLHDARKATKGGVNISALSRTWFSKLWEHRIDSPAIVTTNMTPCRMTLPNYREMGEELKPITDLLGQNGIRRPHIILWMWSQTSNLFEEAYKSWQGIIVWIGSCQGASAARVSCRFPWVSRGSGDLYTPTSALVMERSLRSCSWNKAFHDSLAKSSRKTIRVIVYSTENSFPDL